MIGKQKKKWGDRKDAWLCRDVDCLNQLLIDLKPKRSLGEVYLNEKVDVTKLVNYVDRLKKQNQNITYFHAIMTIIAKIIYNRPRLNRFIANHRMYEHNTISLGFVMKPDFIDQSEEIMVVISINPDDDLLTISQKIAQKVNRVRSHKDEGSEVNSVMQIVGKLPNFLRIPLVGIIKSLDRKGWLPSSLTKDNLYYSSLIISNIGTFKCNGIYHNITDFGTCSGIVIIGAIKDGENLSTGKKECEIGITIDERIADGFYLIKSLKLMQYLLDNPRLLKRRVNEKIKFE